MRRFSCQHDAGVHWQYPTPMLNAVASIHADCFILLIMNSLRSIYAELLQLSLGLGALSYVTESC